MIEERESFIFYRSFYTSLLSLDNKMQLKVLKSIFEYVFFGVKPEWETGIEQAFWETFRQVLDRDAKRWEETKGKRSEAGKKHKGNQYTQGTSVPTMEQNGTNGTDNVNVDKSKEEDVREEQKLMSLKSFVKVWNDVYQKQKEQGYCAIKYIKIQELPEDAEQRLADVLWHIRGEISEETANKLFERNRVPENGRTLENASKWYMFNALEHMASVKMKPKDTSFGSFQWFVKEPTRIKKLYNGDIQ